MPLFVISILSSALLVGPVACSGARPSLVRQSAEPQPATTDAAPESALPQPSPAITNADDLLRALETADADLRTLSAAIMLQKSFALAGDDQARWGTLSFEDRTDAKAPAAARRDRRFAVRFQQLRTGRRIDAEPQVFVFDGATLVESRPTRKEMVKYRLGDAQDRADPLRIGEGPLPLPIGQKRDDITARFDASMLPADADPPGITEQAVFKDHVKGAVQLKLIPRAGLKGVGDLADIRLWYRREGERWLPVAARALNKAGDQTLVWLSDVRVNAPLDPSVWVMEPSDAGWTVVERNLDTP